MSTRHSWLVSTARIVLSILVFLQIACADEDLTDQKNATNKIENGGRLYKYRLKDPTKNSLQIKLWSTVESQFGIDTRILNKRPIPTDNNTMVDAQEMLRIPGPRPLVQKFDQNAVELEFFGSVCPLDLLETEEEEQPNMPIPSTNSSEPQISPMNNNTNISAPSIQKHLQKWHAHADNRSDAKNESTPIRSGIQKPKKQEGGEREVVLEVLLNDQWAPSYEDSQNDGDDADYGKDDSSDSSDEKKDSKKKGNKHGKGKKEKNKDNEEKISDKDIQDLLDSLSISRGPAKISINGANKTIKDKQTGNNSNKSANKPETPKENEVQNKNGFEYRLELKEYTSCLNSVPSDSGTPGKIGGGGADYYYVDVTKEDVAQHKEMTVLVKRTTPRGDAPSELQEVFGVNVPSQKSCPALLDEPYCYVNYQATLSPTYPGAYIFDGAIEVSTKMKIDNGWEIAWTFNDINEKFVGCPTCDQTGTGFTQAGSLVKFHNTQDWQAKWERGRPYKFEIRVTNNNFKDLHIAPTAFTLNGLPCNINSTKVCRRNSAYKIFDCDERKYDSQEGVPIVVKTNKDTLERLLDSNGYKEYYQIGQELGYDGVRARIAADKAVEIRQFLKGRSIKFFDQKIAPRLRSREDNTKKGKKHKLSKQPQNFSDSLEDDLIGTYYTNLIQSPKVASYIAGVGGRDSAQPIRVKLREPGRYTVGVFGAPVGFPAMSYRVGHCFGKECEVLTNVLDDIMEDESADMERYCKENPDDSMCQPFSSGNILLPRTIVFLFSILYSLLCSQYLI